MRLIRPPSSDRLTRQDAGRFLANFLLEARVIRFTDQELGRLTDPRILGRLMNPRTQGFFLYHFGSIFQRVVAALFAPTQHPTPNTRHPVPVPLILDLGCGSGFGSLLFALLGAHVVGLDLDPVLISACRKRQAFYEAEFGPLDLRFELANALSYDYQQLAPIDGVHSLFAFNLIQPSSRLLARVLPALAPNARIVISDGNPHSFYNRLFRPRAVLAPRCVAEMLAAYPTPNTRQPIPPFHTVLDYHCIVPPSLTRSRSGLALGSLGERALNRVGLMRWLGLSYTLTSERSTPSVV
jgi:SAM-dependent methyltransferase